PHAVAQCKPDVSADPALRLGALARCAPLPRKAGWRSGGGPRSSPYRLRRLDRGEAPGSGADRTREGPVPLDVLWRSGPVDEIPGRVVERVIDEGRGNVHRRPVLAALLPRLRHVGALELDLLDPVRLARAPEPVALSLEPRVLLRREPVVEGSHVAPPDTLLDVDEHALYPPGEGRGVEARV